MKILVTVGHTQFNELIQAVDEQLQDGCYEVICQIADGVYKPRHHQYFAYSSEIEKHIEAVDLVITHAGAGSVFSLLEREKPVVVVPNTVRRDKHQLDIGQYVETHKFGRVCNSLIELGSAVESALHSTFVLYQREPFAGYDDILAELALPKIAKQEVVAGIPINLYGSFDDALNDIVDVQSGKVIPGVAIAVNAEKVIKSIKEPEVGNLLLNATLRYADGIGVVRTLARKSRQPVARIPGCELWEHLMARAGKLQLPVFLVGAKPEVIQLTSDKLKAKYSVNIVGTQDGYFADEQEVIERIATLQPAIVSVAQGSPRQEKFIEKCLKYCPNTFFMGVGGTYDVFTDKVKRAPESYRRLNLEWFYRLAKQPHRAFRQTNLLRYLYLELTRRL